MVKGHPAPATAYCVTPRGYGLLGEGLAETARYIRDLTTEVDYYRKLK